MAAKKERQKYLVIARSPDTMKELTAFANGKHIPFDTPVYLTEKQINSLKRQREPIQIEKQISVREIMEKHQVNQTKANEMAKLIAQDPNQGGKKIQYVAKYIVTPA